MNNLVPATVVLHHFLDKLLPPTPSARVFFDRFLPAALVFPLPSLIVSFYVSKHLSCASLPPSITALCLCISRTPQFALTRYLFVSLGISKIRYRAQGASTLCSQPLLLFHPSASIIFSQCGSVPDWHPTASLLPTFAVYSFPLFMLFFSPTAHHKCRSNCHILSNDMSLS
jgi:hypothetical protein